MQFLFPPFTLLSKIYTCYNVECEMLTILHYDHFSNTKCRKLFLYICIFFFFFFFFLDFANATCRNAFFSTNFYILRCVTPYCEKNTISDNTLFEISMKIIYLFSHFCRFIEIHVLSDLSNSIRSENNTLLLGFPDAHANPRNI